MGRWGKAVNALEGRAAIWMGLNRLPETSRSSGEKSAEPWNSVMQVLQSPGAEARLAEGKLCRKALPGAGHRKWNRHK